MFAAALTLALVANPAHALTPPAGWTSTGPHRAVRDVNNPALGEIREFNVTGGTGATVELEMMLRAAGSEPQSLNPDGSGAVGLLLKDQRLGRPVQGGHRRRDLDGRHGQRRRRRFWTRMPC